MKKFKRKIKKKEIYEYRDKLSKCLNINTTVYSLVEAVDENLDYLENKIARFESVIEKTKEHKEFDDKYQSIMKDHAEIGDDGNPIRYISKGRVHFLVKEDLREKCDEAIKSLQQSFKSVLQAQYNKEEGFNKTLEDEITIELISIDKAMIKTVENISPEVRRCLRILVDDSKK